MVQKSQGQPPFETYKTLWIMGKITISTGFYGLRWFIYPIIYRVLYIPGGCLGFLNHPTGMSRYYAGRKLFMGLIAQSMEPP